MIKEIVNPDAPLILGLEASGEQACVALTRGHQVLHEITLAQRHGHASSFVSMAKACLEEASFQFKDLDIIAAGVGPGSFTGLRVCLSAATGFALAGQITAIGVNGLRARAFAAREAESISPSSTVSFLACADTRRGVLFAQSFDSHLQAQSDITEHDISDILAHHPSMRVCLPALDEMPTLPEGVDVITMTARHIAQTAFLDYQHHRQTGAALPPLEPLYVAAPKLGPKKAYANDA